MDTVLRIAAVCNFAVESLPDISFKHFYRLLLLLFILIIYCYYCYYCYRHSHCHNNIYEQNKMLIVYRFNDIQGCQQSMSLGHTYSILKMTTEPGNVNELLGISG